MNGNELIGKARAENRSTLTEAESKILLAAYGVPVVTELTASSPEEASVLAARLGFPVVVKGLGSSLTHKTERGLVHLNLPDAQAVRRAAVEIAQAAGEDLEGWLVQPQVTGRREFVAGLFRDRQFGPVIMFGLGGIFTEALGDVAFRVAPLNEVQAVGMLEELRASRLLNDFRGEKAADRNQLIQALLGLSRLAMEHPEVAEVDINPLLVSPDGRVAAVDALVVLGDISSAAAFPPPTDPVEVGAMFYPKSVAFVGASAQFRKWGHMLFTNVVAGDFEGSVHLVNPKGGVIAERHVYRSVKDIPVEVDLAVVTVPAAGVIGLLPEFEAKGIRHVILITSGFAETGAEGRRLQDELAKEARGRGILILGPNTMGICNPYHNFFCVGSHARPLAGPTAFVSQSGNMGVQLLSFAERQGIGIRAFAGSGNEAMVTIEDALDTFAVDNLTKTVLLYVESVKNGRRFFESAGRVSRSKPVVVLKGGRSTVGSKAAASHTGAMASDNRVFNAACKQAGIVMADQPMDLLDLSAAFSSLPLPRGNRVAIMTLGGGWGVVTADLCHEAGLVLPDLPAEIIGRIDPLLPPFWSKANPVDLVGDTDPSVPVKVMEELMKWPGCDAVINLGIVGRRLGLKCMIESTIKADPDVDRAYLEMIREALTKFEGDYIAGLVKLMEKYQKPVLGVSLVSGEDDKTVIGIDDCNYKGVYFPTPERAVKVLGAMSRYRFWLEGEGIDRV
jgi:acyl-CoA synthetase (NDP forming)